MTRLKQKAKLFAGLHVPGNPLVVCNIWSAGTAKIVEAEGAKALATSSWSVAAASGYEDGERMPRELLIASLRGITRCTQLPVSVDIEAGYGRTAAEVRRTVELTIEAGAVGCNLEDSYPRDGKLRGIPDQVDRIKQARKGAEGMGIDYFINARCDVFLTKVSHQHDESLLNAAVERARAYASEGATGFFVPGLIRPDVISELTSRTTLPVNIMLSDLAAPIDELCKAGVARISYGPAPYLAVVNVLRDLVGHISRK